MSASSAGATRASGRRSGSRNCSRMRRVVLIESDICGGGPSGRNGGFALSWWPKIETLQEAARGRGSAPARQGLRGGDRRDRRVLRARGRRCPLPPGRLALDRDLPCAGGSWEGAVAAAEAYGEHPFELLTAEEVQARTGSPVHLGAALEPGAATVQPALLARGMRRVALERGIAAFTSGHRWSSWTATRGVVRTPVRGRSAPAPSSSH